MTAPPPAAAAATAALPPPPPLLLAAPMGVWVVGAPKILTEVDVVAVVVVEEEAPDVVVPAPTVVVVEEEVPDVVVPAPTVVVVEEIKEPEFTEKGGDQ